jgi:hypothetical protein
MPSLEQGFSAAAALLVQSHGWARHPDSGMERICCLRRKEGVRYRLILTRRSAQLETRRRVEEEKRSRWFALDSIGLVGKDGSAIATWVMQRVENA